MGIDLQIVSMAHALALASLEMFLEELHRSGFLIGQNGCSPGSAGGFGGSTDTPSQVLPSIPKKQRAQASFVALSLVGGQNDFKRTQ